MTDSLPLETQPGRRRLPHEERHQEILDAARGIFARKGFHGTSTADIAAGAGCSEPMLYKHFPSKLTLFAAVLQDAAASMRDQVLRMTADPGEDPAARLATILPRLMAEEGFAEKVRLRSLAVSMADAPEIR